MRKGFLHISETIIMVIMVFVILVQFTSMPGMRSGWETMKLNLMSYDIIYSLDKSGVNWFDPADVQDNLSALLPPTMGFTLRTSQAVRPVMKVGCVCDPYNFSVLEQEILTDFELNGLRRRFELERIDPASIKFSMDNDAMLFWGYPAITDTSQEDFALRNFLSHGRGIVEFSKLTQARTAQAWHQDTFNLEWVPGSSYITTANAKIALLTHSDTAYPVQELFFHSPYEPSPLPGALGYWRMNLGRGGTIWDTTGNGNEGILRDNAVSCHPDYNATYCPLWEDGMTGTCIDFDGSGHYVDLGTGTDVKPTGAMTINAWFLGDSTSTNIAGLGTMGVAGSRGYMLGVSSNGNAGAYIASDADTFVTTGGVPGHDPNKWMMYTLVYKPSRYLKLYRNGIEIGENTTDVPASQYHGNGISLKLGRRGDAVGKFVGRIDEVSMYGRALTDEEIFNLYLRKFPDGHEFGNFLSGEQVYPKDGDSGKILVTQENVYTGGANSGNSVPLAVVNKGSVGSGRSGWISSAPLTSESKQLIKSMVIWSAGELDYDVVTEGEPQESVKSSIFKVLNTDMFELVTVDMTLGFHY